MNEMLDLVESELISQQENLFKQKSILSEKLQQIRDHYVHLRDNKPSFGGHSREEIKVMSKVKSSSSATLRSRGAKSGVSRPKSQTVERGQEKCLDHRKKKNCDQEVYKNVSIPIVEYITVDEFNDIPKYMKGRLTYESLNKSVNDFNQTIESKYQFLATHSSKYSEADMKRYQVYKSQENAESSGEYFCTAQDLKLYSDLKADNTTKIVLTCLRHCKRIKEIRGPAKLIRYAIIK